MRFKVLKLSLLAITLSMIATPALAAGKVHSEKFPITVKSGGFATTIANEPKRIISLSPTATEILFAIGAGKQVLAVDDLSNYPSTAPISKLSAFTPNVEAIAAKKPDLVILSADSTNSKSVKKSLELLMIPVLIEKAPNQISNAYSEIITIGKATNKVPQAVAVVAAMKTKIKAIVSKFAKKSPITFFHELDNTLYSATSQTFIGHVYSDFNLQNIADKAQGADASGYPQLSQEYLVTANPQIIFLSDAQYGESSTTVAARAGWSEISAVKNNHVVALPADIPSRWGPRLVDFYQIIANSIAKIS
jgi:iron complex transport system substrate-binding protein